MTSYNRIRVVHEPYHFYSYKNGYVQRAPFVDPLPYEASIVKHHDFKVLWYDTPRPVNDARIGFFASSGPALNKAYERFIACTKDSINLSEDLAERKSSIDMMTKRLSQLVRFAKALSTFQFVKAAHEIGLSVVKQKKGRRTTKLTVVSNGQSSTLTLKKGLNSLGSNWLEYHFGWSPIMQDIEYLLQIAFHKLDLGSYRRCIGTASIKKPTITPTFPNSENVYTIDTYTRISARVAAFVTVTDENALLLNQLGLINPAVTAWNLVPFSFVIDWFTNIQTVLSGYTDLVGLSLTGATTTISGTWERKTYRVTKDPSLGSGYHTYIMSEDLGTSMSRTLGVGTPTLPSLRPVKLPSVVRALTASSLLSQFLGLKR